MLKFNLLRDSLAISKNKYRLKLHPDDSVLGKTDNKR